MDILLLFFVFFWGGGGRGHHKIGLYLGVISMHFRVKVQNMAIFLGVARISNIFWRCLKFLIFFGVNGKKKEYPPSPRPYL